MYKYTLHTWFNFNNLASMPGRNVEMIVWMKLQVQKQDRDNTALTIQYKDTI